MALVTVARTTGIAEGEVSRFEGDGREIAVVDVGEEGCRAREVVCAQAVSHRSEVELDVDYGPTAAREGRGPVSRRRRAQAPAGPARPAPAGPGVPVSDGGARRQRRELPAHRVQGGEGRGDLRARGPQAHEGEDEPPRRRGRHGPAL